LNKLHILASRNAAGIGNHHKNANHHRTRRSFWPEHWMSNDQCKYNWTLAWQNFLN